MADQEEIFAKLDRVTPYRARTAPLFRELVANSLADLGSAGPIVEVGSGDGFLRAHLPEGLRVGLVLTEPTDIGVARLRKRFPDAAVATASIEALPFEDNSVGAVLACCVFDVVPSLSRAFDEMHRVLKPGGHIIHWLDLATDLHALFAEIIEEGGLVAIPNVFTDPIAVEFPEDIMLIPRAQLDLVAHVLGRHPAAATLKNYRRAFQKSPEDAVGIFSAFNESTQQRKSLKDAFSLAMKRASETQRRKLAEFSGRPVSSSFVFHKRLQSLRIQEFRLLRCEIVRTEGVLPRAESEPGAYRSVVGYIQSGEGPAPDTCHTELGVHLFHAQKR